MNLQKISKDKVKKLYPNYNGEEFPEATLEILNNLQNFIDENDEIFTNKEKYNLEWALKNSQEKINNFSSKMFARAEEKLIEFKKENPELFKEFKKRIIVTRKIRIKRKIRSYTFAYHAIFLLDIIISFILVSLISELAHFGESLFTSALLGTIFFTFTILLKVTLDRLYFVPKINKWGWKKYNTINENFKKSIPDLIANMFICRQLSQDHKEKELVKFISKK